VIEKKLIDTHDIVILIPSLNNERGIATTMNSVREELGSKYRSKIVLVADSSSQRTPKIANE